MNAIVRSTSVLYRGRTWKKGEDILGGVDINAPGVRGEIDLLRQIGHLEKAGAVSAAVPVGEVETTVPRTPKPEPDPAKSPEPDPAPPSPARGVRYSRRDMRPED